jgi:MarR family transcriptional regulator, transcriptional regulator for hemolysin
MVRIVDYLQKKKYVKRKQNAADRRAHFITLTDKAEKIIPDIRNAFQYVDTIALQSLKPDQIKILKQFFAAIESNLVSMPATEVKLNFKRTKK